MLIDVHAHLDDPVFDKDLARVIDDAKKAGLRLIISAGINHDSNLKTLEIAKKYKDLVLPSLGLYPIDAEFLTKEEIDNEIKFIASKKPKVLGEVGLDGKYGKDMGKQEYAFRKFLFLAKKLDIPIVIHARNAEHKVLEILEEINHNKVILHCFTGNKSLIEKANKLGCYFSIPSIICRDQHFQMLVSMINIHKLLTETDSPVLSPFPNKKNEPKNVRECIHWISKIKNITPEETKKIIFMTAQKLFLKR